MFSLSVSGAIGQGLVKRRNRERAELETSGVKEIERKRGTTPNPRGINAQSTFLQLYNTLLLNLAKPHLPESTINGLLQCRFQVHRCYFSILVSEK